LYVGINKGRRNKEQDERKAGKKEVVGCEGGRERGRKMTG